jgi:hypothetical protein
VLVGDPVAGVTAAEIFHRRQEHVEIVQAADGEAQGLQQLLALREHVGRPEQLARGGVDLEQPAIEQVGYRIGYGHDLLPGLSHESFLVGVHRGAPRRFPRRASFVPARLSFPASSVDRREISDVLGRQMLGLLHQLERVDRRRGQDLLGPHIPRSDDGHRRNQAQADHGQGYGDDTGGFVHCDLHQPTDGSMVFMLAAAETTSLWRTLGRS